MIESILSDCVINQFSLLNFWCDVKYDGNGDDDDDKFIVESEVVVFDLGRNVYSMCV